MKNELRKKYLYIRNTIENKLELDEIIYHKIINNKKILESKLLLTYVSFNNEVDTINIIKYFLNKKDIAVPRIDNGIMNFYYIKSLDELKEGYNNILEPITNNIVVNYENSVCLTPGICFDLNMYRLGYGKGFYDRFFNNIDTYSIGLCYKKCLVKKIETNKYDKKVNEIITD